MDITIQRYYREYLAYNSRTGVLTWKKIPKHCYTINIGDKAGSISPEGYRILSINGKAYRSHRVIWYCEMNEMPNMMDHINGKRDDNRLCNLRNVTVKENNRNASKSSKNTSGFTGVTYVKSGSRNKRWRADIRHNDKRKCLGYFISKEEAIIARKQANIDCGYHVNHGR